MSIDNFPVEIVDVYEEQHRKKVNWAKSLSNSVQRDAWLDFYAKASRTSEYQTFHCTTLVDLRNTDPVRWTQLKG